MIQSGARSMPKTLNALLLILLAHSAASTAAPIVWTFDSTSLMSPSGQFTFDASTSTYSDVNIVGFLLDDYVSASGTALSLTSNGDFFGDLLSISFNAPLTDLGGTVAFTGFEDAGVFGIFDIAGSVIAPSQSVPAPATLALLGLGVLGLRLGRKA